MRNLWASLSLGLASTYASGKDTKPSVQNSNHIFNAIHSSMRQWGSSLIHNGMSLFLATVPKGVELYHGTSEPARINGTEWLAFEPEHALVFARSHRGPPPGRGGPPEPERHPHDDEAWHPPERFDERSRYMPWHGDSACDDLEPRHPRHDDRPLTHTAGQRARARMQHEQQRLFIEENSPEDQSYGYLHTYQPKKDLRLLYIDGQSAAKSDKGTLDMQDIVLLHDNPPPKGADDHPPLREPSKDGHRRPGGPMGEVYRAEKLCELAQTEWQGQIDGFLRMELGFEIILCSFERDLDVKRITRATSQDMGGSSGPGGNGNGLNYYQAVASRFDGIGGHRVTLSYDNFISLFAAEGAMTFNEKKLPRARNDSNIIRTFLTATKEMILQPPTTDPKDWQAVADMVVTKYADRIQYLASGDVDNLKSFKAELRQLLRPFIDYGNRNTTLEIHRCATQYVPELSSSSGVAAVSVLNVATTICSTLSNAAEASTHKEALDRTQSLKSWLAWPIWKRCRGCGYNEVCFVPIWPMGGEQEHEHPRCVSNMSEISRGYWGDRGPGPHHRSKSSNKNDLR
ncbi:hypothetical protein M409DRAFT_69030 [Zasmidium cellare ATCC 36951]|uniref:Uncharacterized protein n=1 Tax=Zasmidium cellare ATCC 36951 TaxID=1080233 RepID=A0A6A6C5E4_ZASCE|nr:uncharacterized protein M409DRAFT_69030 [Zasmidium cellare ATCC 36951]KAF2162397.1 hypothetical protein M409DRAFT_69030 [Zasmidium cellare ATCC 36951]